MHAPCHPAISLVCNFVESRRCSTDNTIAVVAAAARRTTSMLPMSSTTNSALVSGTRFAQVIGPEVDCERPTADAPGRILKSFLELVEQPSLHLALVSAISTSHPYTRITAHIVAQQIRRERNRASDLIRVQVYEVPEGASL
jgi:hypothetical protein